VGRLTDNALADAIDRVERAIELGERPNTRDVATALGDAIKAIAPVTLLDLRMGRSPFDPAYQRKLKHRQYRLVSLTVLLAVMIAYYSIALHREENALRDLQEVQSARIMEKVGSLRKLVQHEEAFSARDSRYDQYRQLVSELRDLEARRSAVYSRVYELSGESDWPFVSTSLDGVRRLFSSGTDPVKDAATTDVPSASMAMSPYSDDICAGIKPTDGKTRTAQASGWLAGMSVEELNEYCFLQKLAIVGSGVSTYASPVQAVSVVRDRILLQSAWILPFLSGLLGAAVFLMRDALDPRTATIGSTLSIVRLAMGGIAGIIIGWFWTPTNATATGVGVVSSVPFGLAFVTGFSIEILFSALDRVNRSIVDEGARGHKEPRLPAPEKAREK
jgi:hypothetical protein